MPAELSAALPLIVLGLVLLVVAAWLLTRISRRAKVVQDDSAPALAHDVLNEGATKAQRNQALIDAPQAAAIVEPVAATSATPTPVMATPVIATPGVATPAAVASLASTPEPSAMMPAGPAAADDIARIKGIGPKLVVLLGELGVTTFAQIATWSDADIERIDAQLGRFKGRITRDQWIMQAALLAAGKEAQFADQFGKNG